jgi:hypothetical protein
MVYGCRVASLEVGLASGYASRAHYVWVSGAFQHFAERGGDRFGDSRFVTAVYGYRPPALRTEAGRPDLRFFVEMTSEDRGNARVSGLDRTDGARTVFVGPTSLLLHKAFGVEAGVLFPAYQRVEVSAAREGGETVRLVPPKPEATVGRSVKLTVH